jgi:hypothetical protein
MLHYSLYIKIFKSLNKRYYRYLGIIGKLIRISSKGVI